MTDVADVIEILTQPTPNRAKPKSLPNSTINASPVINNIVEKEEPGEFIFQMKFLISFFYS